MENTREQQALQKQQQQRAEEKKQLPSRRGTDQQRCSRPQQGVDQQQQQHGCLFLGARGEALQQQQQHRQQPVTQTGERARGRHVPAAAAAESSAATAAAGATRVEGPSVGLAAATKPTGGVMCRAADAAASRPTACGGSEEVAAGGAAAAAAAGVSVARSGAATRAPAPDSLRTARPASGIPPIREDAAAVAGGAGGSTRAAAAGRGGGEHGGRGATAAGGSEGRAAAGGRATMSPEASRFHHHLSSSTIVVSQRQRSNPLLQLVRAVPIAVENISPDFLVGASACVLFLSLRYHQLYPKYIHSRMQSLQQARYARRFLLVHVDLEVPDTSLAQVTVLAFHNNYSLLLGSSLVECAGLLQLLKVYENKPPDALLARKQDVSHSARVMELLSTVSAINKTDALTLAREFCTMKNLLTAPKERLEKCHGIGVKKVKRMTKVFHDPFFEPC